MMVSGSVSVTLKHLWDVAASPSLRHGALRLPWAAPERAHLGVHVAEHHESLDTEPEVAKLGASRAVGGVVPSAPRAAKRKASLAIQLFGAMPSNSHIWVAVGAKGSPAHTLVPAFGAWQRRERRGGGAGIGRFSAEGIINETWNVYVPNECPKRTGAPGSLAKGRFTPGVPPLAVLLGGRLQWQRSNGVHGHSVNVTWVRLVLAERPVLLGGCIP